MTLPFLVWVEVTDNLPAGMDRDNLIQRVDDAYNGHQLTEPLTLDLGHHEAALVRETRYRMAVDAAFAARSISI